MKKMVLFISLMFLFAAFAAAKAASQHDIIINEIAWMGTTTSAENEWMELFNTTKNPIDLTGWALRSDDGKLKIPLKGNIGAQGFYLLERTDDSSVPNINANFIYKGLLPNSGTNLRLYDDNNIVIDSADFSSGWPAGDNTTKQTMERTASLSWQTSKEPNGTPAAQNSTGRPSEAATPKTVAAKTGTTLSKAEKSDNSETSDTSLASLENSLPAQNKAQPTNPWILFISAIGTIVVLGIVAILIKFNLIKKNVRP